MDHVAPVAAVSPLEQALGSSLALVKAGGRAPFRAPSSPRLIDAAGEAIAAVRSACPRLRGRFVTGVLSSAPRDIWLRYYPLGASKGDEPSREWLFRAGAAPALVELV